MKILFLIALLFSCSNEEKKEIPETNNPTQESPQTQPTPQPQPPISLPGGQGDVVEVQQFMIFHNLKRCWHDAPRLKWSEALADAAKDYAATCTLSKFDPQDSIAVGESLGQVKAQDDWYMEFLSYPWNGDTFNDNQVGNFARMVWQDSTYFGCAHVKCGPKDVYYCKYAPRANPQAAKGKVKFLKKDFMTCNGTN